MFEIERDLYIQGKRYIIGIDEVGRGPLAGDVVAAAVCVDFSDEKHFIEGIRDSKKLSDKKRREMASLIRENVVDFSISGASPRVIDKINILQAT
ncbi:MAG: ribonuclease HII, partial [Tissierellia bacterium]|nr:ribonuclease HII [Tissierellia bacterium]